MSRFSSSDTLIAPISVHSTWRISLGALGTCPRALRIKSRWFLLQLIPHGTARTYCGRGSTACTRLAAVGEERPHKPVLIRSGTEALGASPRQRSRPDTWSCPAQTGRTTMEALTLIIAIIALVVALVAFARTGGVQDLRHQVQ